MTKLYVTYIESFVAYLGTSEMKIMVNGLKSPMSLQQTKKTAKPKTSQYKQNKKLKIIIIFHCLCHGARFRIDDGERVVAAEATEPEDCLAVVL